ncbi:hypothetical protein [Halocatena halophila]|uniref:hypothetical protein n=1 Tax=Halocatena halophila TaxID=2814576 RepID=UPI002ED4C06A
MTLGETIIPFLAALFAYLSWKQAAIASPYELESAVRNRLKDSQNITNFYRYQLGRVQIAEYSGWGYVIWKYLPYIGGTKGDGLIYLNFTPPEGGKSPVLPSTEEISNHPSFASMPICSITWKSEPHTSDDGKNLEIVFNTTDPDEILKSITDLSGIMIEINSEETQP